MKTAPFSLIIFFAISKFIFQFVGEAGAVAEGTSPQESSLHVFCIGPARYQAELKELEQFGITYTLVPVDRSGEVSGEHLSQLSSNLKKTNVLIMSNVNTASWSSALQKEIIDFVRKGGGLVYIPSKKEGGKSNLFSSAFLPILVNGGIPIPVAQVEILKDHYVVAGIVPQLWPRVSCFVGWNAGGQILAKSESGQPIIAIKEEGKGRIVYLNLDCWVVTPRVLGKLPEYPYWEYFQKLILNSIQWVSKDEPNIYVKRVEIPDNKVAGGTNIKINFSFHSKGSEFSPEVVGIELNALCVERGLKRRVRFEKRVDKIEKELSLIVPTEGWPAGFYMVDIAITGKRWEHLTKTYFELIPPIEIKDISLDKKIYKPSSPIQVEVNLENRLSKPIANTSLEIKIKDMDNRVHAIGQQGIEPFQDKLVQHLNFKTPETTSGATQIEVLIMQNGEVIDSKKIYSTIRKPFDWSDFFFATWGGGMDFPRYLLPKLYSVIKNMGIDIIDGWMRVDYATIARRHGMKLIPTNVYARDYRNPPYQVPGPKYSCFSAFERIETTSRTLRENIREWRDLDVMGYILQDEPSLRWSDDFDVCFSESCQDHLRKYLKEAYGTLERLNKAWGTEYRRWEKVKGIIIDKSVTRLKEGKSLAPWVDFRLCMEEVFADYWKVATDIVHNEDPGSFSSINLCTWNGIFNGGNGWRLSKALDTISGTSNVPDELKDAFPYPLFCHINYIPYKGVTVGEAWRKAMGGSRGFVYYTVLGLPPYDMINLDLTYSKKSRQIMEAIRPFKEGGGKIFATSKYFPSQIALYHSQPSLMVCGAEEWDPDSKEKFPRHLYNSNKGGFSCGLHELHYPFDVITQEEILVDGLNQYKVLILPYSVCISEEIALKIKNFVRNGGTLIANGKIGLYDDHGTPYPNWSGGGILNEILGIIQKGLNRNFSEFQMEVVDPVFGLSPGEKTSVHGREDEIEVAGGKLLAKYDDEKPAIIIKHFGKGQSVFLNFYLEKFSRASRSDAYYRGPYGLDYRIKFRKILHNILKSVQVDSIIQEITDSKGGDSDEIGTCLLQRGDIIYIPLIRYFSDGKGRREKFFMHFDRKKYIYNVLNKKNFGLTDKIELSLSLNDRTILALLPYEVKGIKARSSSNTVCVGSKVTIDVEVEVSEGRAVNHIIRVKATDPHGKEFKPFLQDFLLKNSKGKRELFFAYNDMKGKWTIITQDLISGKESKLSLFVE